MNNCQIDISIVIVCMNNLKMLYPCLDSIKKQTHKVTYEVLVTAYLFTSENLAKSKKDYPWVKFIESNKIRGFSENNNLALRQANGKYIFVLNDDTEMNTIGKLINSIESLPNDVAIVSPKILLGNEEEVLLGKPKYNFYTYLMSCIGLGNKYYYESPYTFQKGLFQTYNISGAAFLIKTEIFKSLGWFDEKYFFCPEDIALSTLVNRKGYRVYCDADAVIYHYSGGTWSTTITATKPASVKGAYLFYCENSFLKQSIFIPFVSIIHFARMCYWLSFGKHRGYEKAKVMAKANWNAVKALFSKKTPKELFIKYYKVNKQSISVK